MKDLCGYLRWVGRNLSIYKLGYIISMVCIVASWFVPVGLTFFILLGIGMSISFSYLCYFLIWVSIRDSFQKYKKERQDLLTKIRGDDDKS